MQTKIQTIGPNDILQAGTEVTVGGKIGHIVKHEHRRDQFGGSIVVHTIHFFKKYSHKAPGPEGMRWIYKPISETTSVNYSAIKVNSHAN